MQNNLNQRFYIRSFITYPKNVGIFVPISNTGTLPGTYQLSLALSSFSNTSSVQTLTPQSVDVIQPITGLSLVTTFCMINGPCTLTASMTTGSSYNLSWLIGVTPPVILYTNTTSLTYTFTSGGIISLTLTASNLVTNPNVTLTTTVQVVDKLMNLSFYAGNSLKSASSADQSAEFMFTLLNGCAYSCTVDFGDNSATLSFTDQPNLNGTFIRFV